MEENTNTNVNTNPATDGAANAQQQSTPAPQQQGQQQAQHDPNLRTFTQEQLDAIRFLVRQYGLDGLPEPLRDTALLRLANPEASLADLAQLSMPPVTKSCLNHRMKKILSLASREDS